MEEDLANGFYFKRKWSKGFKQMGQVEENLAEGVQKGTFWGQVKGPTEAE